MLTEKERHSEEYRLRFTPDQAKAIEGLAAIAGLPPAVWLRQMVAGELVRQAYQMPSHPLSEHARLEVPQHP